jgi:hypothetical protein
MMSPRKTRRWSMSHLLRQWCLHERDRPYSDRPVCREYPLSASLLLRRLRTADPDLLDGQVCGVECNNLCETESIARQGTETSRLQKTPTVNLLLLEERPPTHFYHVDIPSETPSSTTPTQIDALQSSVRPHRSHPLDLSRISLQTPS